MKPVVKTINGNNAGPFLVWTKKLKVFTIAAAALLGAALSSQAVVTYTGNFDSGTDSWEAKNSTGGATYSTLANSTGGQSGNCLKAPEGGYSVGIRRLVTGVAEGEDYTLSLYYKFDSASGTWATPPKAFLRQETSAGALVGSLKSSTALTRDGAWHQVTLTGTISATATQVRIGIEGSTSGVTFNFYIDTVSFVSVNNSAQDRTWTGLGADDNISTVGNWDTGVPTNVDSVIFDGSVRLGPILDSSRTIADLTFASGAGAFAITRPGTEVLTVAGNIVNSSANLQTIGAQVTISGSSRSIDTGSAGLSNTAGTVASSGFTKLGSGTLTLSGGSNPNLAGTITVNAGTLALGSSDQIADSAILNLASGTIFDLNSNNETIGRFAASSTTTPGEVHLGSGQLTISTTASGTTAFYAGDITGTSGSKFIKAGTGEIRLYRETINNTFERLEVQAGIYRLGHGAAPNGSDAMLGAVPSSPVADQITLSGGTLSFNGETPEARINVNANRGITVSAASSIETLVDALIPGNITGSGALTKSGTRYLELSGANDFSGGLTLAGPVIADSAAAVGTGAISFANSGQLVAGAEGITFTNAIDLSAPLISSFDGVTNYTLSGDVNLGGSGSSTRITITSGKVTMSGALTNSLGLVKDGPGTLVLSGTSSYEGATVVSNGILHVTGIGSTSTNTVTVADTGTLSGSGTISGSVTVEAGGTVSPGASPGTLITGDLVFNGGGTNVVEMDDATGVAGVNWDLVNVNGTLTINATIADKFTINPSAVSIPANFNGANTYDWTIVTTTGGIVGFDAAAFDVPTNNFNGVAEGASFTVKQVGNDLVLHYSLYNPPLVTAEPTASQTVASGTTVILSATVSGTQPITYQWQKDGLDVVDGGDIAGAQTATLTLANTIPANSGSYVLLATNSVGDTSSSAALVTVLDPPAIAVEPSGADVSEGGNFNPTATVTGGGTLLYQWKKDGVDLVNGGNISGADTASLLITGVTVDQTGDYTLFVTNEVGNTSSSAAHLKVLAAPVITIQPQNTSVLDGETAQLSVTATGNDLEYQWSRNGAAIAGATDSAYSVTASAATIGYYTVVVSNSLGTATSDTAKISISGTTIVNEPFDYADTAAMLLNWGTDTTGATLNTSSGLPAPSGHHDGTAHAHIWTGSTLSATPSDANPIVLSADLWYNGTNNQRNTIGFRTSANPLYEIGFYNGTPGNGLSARFVSFAGNESWVDVVPYTTLGTGAQNAKWIRVKTTFKTLETKVEYDLGADGTIDGSYISTAAGAETNDTANTFSDLRFGGPSGVSSAGGAFDVDNIKLSVSAPAAEITAQPESVSTNAGSQVVFSVTAPGATVYQWKKNGVDIAGATDSSLTLNSVLKADEGSYTVYVENGFDVTTSDAATLTVADPVILTQPVGSTNGIGATAVFNVVAAGTPTLTYQWQKDGADLVDGGNISGATSDTLTVANITVSDVGSYTVAVTNSLGDGVISDPAPLATIDPPAVTNAMASQTAFQGANVTFDAGVDGVLLSYQWYLGANPIGGATDSALTISNVQPVTSEGAYTVVASNLAGSVSNAASLVVIPDITAPKVTVLTPKKNGGTNSAFINVTGVAKDTGTGNSGIISAVKFVHNGGSEVNATITDLTKGAWSFTSASPIELTPGTNTLDVWAVDLAGNISTHVPFNFYYDTTNTVTLVINGNSSTHVKMGTANIWNVGTNVVTNLKVGRSYRFDAYVDSGVTTMVFTNWTTLPNEAGHSTNNWVQKDSLTFVVQSNMVITANFMTNPFTAVAGTYNGLFSETNGVTHETAGFIQVKVKDKSTFSGYLMLDGIKRPFSGKLQTDGTVSREVARTKVVAQDPVTLNLAVDLDGEQISGTVVGPSAAWTSEILADKAVFSDKAVPAVLDTNYAGNYTFQLPQGIGAPTSSPGGVSYGTVSNSAAGVVKMGGSLADGQKISQKINLSREGHWPLYVGLYKNTSTKVLQGSLMGWVNFATNADFGPSNIVNWIKKDGTTVLGLYPAGFSNSVELAGSPYVTPALGQLPIALSVNDMIIVSDGDLGTPITNLVTAIDTTKAKVTLSPVTTEGATNKASIVFKAKDGTFTGGFFVNPTTKRKTQGVVLQNTGAASGYFTNGTQSGTIRIESAAP